MSTKTTDLGNGVTITITRCQTQTEPPIHVYQVEIIKREGESAGSWTDTLASKEHLRAYLRGFEAAGSMIGGRYIPMPETP